MSKNIKISNIDSEKLLNGEMNEDGIKIGDENIAFLSSSFDKEFDYVRAEAEVGSSNLLKDVSSYYDEEHEYRSGNYKLNVTFCKNGKIELVDSVDYLNDYEERNIDNVFPFNEICLVTKSTVSSGLAKSTWIDNAYPNRGYYVTNREFLFKANGDSNTYVPKELTSNEHDDLFIENLEDDDLYYTKTFVRIPRFYLRIYFFLNKKDNIFYRRYEIISPSVYESLPNELKFGFFVPKAFGDDKYLYISHVPESFGLVSSPFGSETGYFDETNIIISSKLNKFKVMTSDVWFGIVHILFKIYIGYMNPRSLLSRYFYNYQSVYKKQWDGVNSIFSIYHNHGSSSGEDFFQTSNEGNSICLDVVNNVFISEANPSDPPKKYIVSNTPEPCENMKGFIRPSGLSSSAQQIHQNVLKFSTPVLTRDKYLVTNIVFWNAAPSLSLDDPDNTPIYCDVSMVIDTSINLNDNYSFTCYRYKDRYIDPPVLEEIYHNSVTCTTNTSTDRIYFEFVFDSELEEGTFDPSSVSVQFVLFKERFTGDKKKIVKDTLLGKNVILGCRTTQNISKLSKQDEVAYIDAQFYDPDESDPETPTDYLYSYNLNFLNYDFGIHDSSDIVKFNREYDSMKIKEYFDAWNSQNYKVSLYRHPMHEIFGNYYNCDKRFFVDLYKKNDSVGCRFSLLYFSNFLFPFSYRKFSQIKNNTYYPKHISRYNMPYLGDDEVVNFSELEPQQGVLLNDVYAVLHKMYSTENSGSENIYFIYDNGYIIETNQIHFHDTSSPISVVGNEIAEYFYSDRAPLHLIPVSYYDNILSSVFVYDKETYYMNLPVLLKEFDYNKGYDIQKPMCASNGVNSDYTFWVSSGYLQLFDGTDQESSVSVDQINDKISFNLSGISFTRKDTANSSISQQNVLLYISGN